ncbi:hypothetical protein SDC9_192583 [bioreactor metagenome]|uniref:Uncharacterized protein n=1 Tax=bioreactor metagenome TaxID=1076179 RepID=A0A645I2E3_9ZZZZ
MGKVKAQTVGLHQGTGLLHMVSQNGTQGLVQQMGRGVGTHDGLPAWKVNGGSDRVAQL